METLPFCTESVPVRQFRATATLRRIMDATVDVDLPEWIFAQLNWQLCQEIRSTFNSDDRHLVLLLLFRSLDADIFAANMQGILEFLQYIVIHFPLFFNRIYYNYCLDLAQLLSFLPELVPLMSVSQQRMLLDIIRDEGIDSGIRKWCIVPRGMGNEEYMDGLVLISTGKSGFRRSKLNSYAEELLQIGCVMTIALADGYFEMRAEPSTEASRYFRIMLQLPLDIQLCLGQKGQQRISSLLFDYWFSRVVANKKDH